MPRESSPPTSFLFARAWETERGTGRRMFQVVTWRTIEPPPVAARRKTSETDAAPTSAAHVVAGGSPVPWTRRQRA
eukprot:2534776-Alexandrium_andersonii.AAC.1